MKIMTFLLVFLLGTHLYALQEDKIFSTMQEKVDFATKTLMQKDKKIQEKAKQIFSEIEGVFDMPLMGRLSLGKYWNTLSQEQQNLFLPLFEEFMKNSYINQLELYNNEKITIKELEKIKENRIYLHSQIQGEKEVFKIIYKFHKNPQNNWLIYDVDIIGVSIIKTYKAQFEDIMANNSFDYLIEKLKNR